MLFSITFILAICQVVMGGNHMKYTPSESALTACNRQARNTVKFCNPSLVPNCICSNQNFVATMMGCGRQHKIDVTAYMKYYIRYCSGRYDTYNLTIPMLEDHLSYYDKFAVTTAEIPNFNKSKIVTLPIKFNQTQLELYAQGYDKLLGNFNRSVDYSAGLLGYWGIIMLFAAIAHWTRILFPNLVFKLTDPITSSWRKHVTMPAINKKSDQALTFKNIPYMLVPTRWESLVIFMFIIITIGLNAHLYDYDPRDPVLVSRFKAHTRYCADRSGITGTFLIPLLILFAGRNNFLQFLTGLHYKTFITYHKWIARVTTILIIIHSVTFSINFIPHYAEHVEETYLIWGIIGTISMSLLLVQATMYFRRRWYEIFLLIHIALAILFLAGAWVHLADLGFTPLAYAAVGVWGLDRLVRICRLLYFGIAKAKVVLLADETLRVVIPKPKGWKIIPGGYAFIHFIRPTCFWQSHPFTFCENPTNPKEIILYCKVKGGITHGLYKYLATCPGNTATISVTLEGPYGEAAPVKRHDRAIYVASGNGIPGIYSEVYSGMKKLKNDKQEIKLIWIIREYRSLVWFHEELKSLKNDRVKVIIYVTNPSSTEYATELSKFISNDDGLEESKKDTDSEKSDDVLSIINKNPQFNHLEFRQGRPNLKELVVAEIIESPGPIAFVTCGHPQMVDNLRYEVSQNIEKVKGRRVDFYNQLEVWA